jgi:hypothetical protein
MPPMRNARPFQLFSNSSSMEGDLVYNRVRSMVGRVRASSLAGGSRETGPLRSGPGGTHLLRRLYSLFFIFLAIISSHAQDIPSGFSPNRYQKLWERNPFTLPTHAAAQAEPALFDKLVMVSWLKEGKNDVVFVQNSETNEVQKITREPNSNNLKLLELRPNQDPKLAEAVLSNGTGQGPVKFKMEAPNPEQAAATAGMPVVPPENQNQNQNQRIPQIPGQAQNPLLQSLAGQTPGQQVQPNPGVSPLPEQTRPPRAQEFRRKRVLPPQPRQMPVMPQNGNQAINPRQTQE